MTENSDINNKYCIASLTCYMSALYCIGIIFYSILSIYGIVLLGLEYDNINLLWYNLLVSIIITNFTNYNIFIDYCKKNYTVKLLSFNSCINCILSSGTLANILHNNYDDNSLYTCILITMISQYVLMVCDLFLINMHYMCRETF
jgi:hypothetical protein